MNTVAHTVTVLKIDWAIHYTTARQVVNSNGTQEGAFNGQVYTTV